MNSWRPSEHVGPYVLVEPLGAGGMGEVWKARDPRVGRTVAIKRLKPEYAERFKQEARAIAALNHPHICQLYDVGDDYLVMEYVAGAPLRCPQPAEQAVRLALQIADALHEAHSKGIVHRDLKPANVLVNERGTAKLLPLNPLLRLFPCELLLMKDDPKGETESLKLLELHPEFWIAMGWLSPYYARHGRLDEARAYAERAHRLVPYHHGITGTLAAILNLQGDVDGAASLLSNARPDESFGAPLLYFNYHVGLGDFASAARWLEKSIEQRDTRAPWILPNLWGPAFTASPYWPRLARKMNLPV